MRSKKISSLTATWLALGLGACDNQSARDNYARQLEACGVAERNGLLDAAVHACGKALVIAEEQAYGAELLSGLLFRLGRLERQRGRFQDAEPLLKRSLALEEPLGSPAAVASRLVELSFSLAGQDRWSDGVRLLERAAPLVGDLRDDERKAAIKAFGAFGVRLGRLGQAAQAEHFKVIAEDLDGG